MLVLISLPLYATMKQKEVIKMKNLEKEALLVYQLLKLVITGLLVEH